MRAVLVAHFAAVILAGALVAETAAAAPPFVERRQTLPTKTYSVDVGFGLGRYDYRPGETGVGPGANLDVGIALKEHLEMGFSLGMRFGNEGKFAAGDNYANLADYRTFGRDGNPSFTPELRLKPQIFDSAIFELSLEVRAGLSVGDAVPSPLNENSTRPTVRAGAPVALHAGKILRFDTGAFVRLVFAEETRTAFLVPAELWIQPVSRFWVGPRGGFLLLSPEGDTEIQAGLGAGYQATGAVDIKASFMFPSVETRENWGAGVGLQFRVE